jgi:hypothetical protein
MNKRQGRDDLIALLILLAVILPLARVTGYGRR